MGAATTEPRRRAESREAARRVAVVTGATSGIGLPVARGLARSGFAVALVGRDPERLTVAATALRTEGESALASTHLADLSRTLEVLRLAAELRTAHPSIAVLVNGAGAIFLRREESSEGHERTWALNVRAPYLLTRELLPALSASGGGARVVNVASAAHRGARLDLDDPEGRVRYRGWRAYGRSKLALILLTRARARRDPPERVAHFAVHPGFVRTRFGMNHGIVVRGGMRAAMLFAITPVRGARTVLYAARAPALAGRTGEYLAHERVVAPSSAALDDATGERLWQYLEQTTR